MLTNLTRIGDKAVRFVAVRFVLVGLSASALAGCALFGGGGGRNDEGELVGVPNRKGWVMTVPYGMVPIPAGTFHMGQTDEDPASTMINFNKQITVGPFFMDDTEITNNEYRQFTDFFLSDEGAGEIEGFPSVSTADFREKYYPDSTVWVRDFTHHMGDPIQDYYYWHPGYDDYPVVGINWKAAVFFGEWRTAYLNDYRASVGDFPMPNFRLPSEAEWEYASRGGRDMAKYPWGNPYIRNAKGCLLANFKPGRGNFYDDGFAYTSPVSSYFPNDYGLFDTSGNVSEWCLDDFTPVSVPTVWDMNPQYIDPEFDENSSMYNPDASPKKVVRGGSWKDISYYLQTGTRTFEFQDSSRAYIGFRCVVTHLGRSSGREF